MRIIRVTNSRLKETEIINDEITSMGRGFRWGLGHGVRFTVGATNPRDGLCHYTLILSVNEAKRLGEQLIRLAAEQEKEANANRS